MQILYESPSKIILNNDQLIVNGRQHPRDSRKLSKLKDVLKGNPDLDKGDPDIYYMFREVYRKGDIRFDITLIKAMEIEGEFSKTYGHAHPEASKGISYPEVYQVLLGEATFLLQKINRDESVDVALIKAKKGDVLIIPPNFAHVTINTGSEDLILSNNVYDKFESDYSQFKTNKGAAVYLTTDGNIEQNSNYIIHNISRPKIDDFNKRYNFESTDMLTELDQNPEKFGFLKDPNLLFKQ